MQTIKSTKTKLINIYGGVPTHLIYFENEKTKYKNDQYAIGKTDLHKCIREMLNDGMTKIIIETVEVEFEENI